MGKIGLLMAMVSLVGASAMAEVADTELLLFQIGQSPEGFSSTPLNQLEVKIEICDGKGANCQQVPAPAREFPSNKYFDNCPKCEGTIKGQFVSIGDLRAIVSAQETLRNSESLVVKWQLQEPSLESNPVASTRAGLTTSDILTGSRLRVDMKDGTYLDLPCKGIATTNVANQRLPTLFLLGFVKRVNCGP